MSLVRHRKLNMAENTEHTTTTKLPNTTKMWYTELTGHNNSINRIVALNLVSLSSSFCSLYQKLQLVRYNEHVTQKVGYFLETEKSFVAIVTLTSHYSIICEDTHWDCVFNERDRCLERYQNRLKPVHSNATNRYNTVADVLFYHCFLVSLINLGISGLGNTNLFLGQYNIWVTNGFRPKVDIGKTVYI